MKNHILTSALLSITTVVTVNMAAQNFSGSFSSEGDVTAKGIFKLDLNQTAHKIEGTGTYQILSTGESSGLMSVNGFIKDDVAYLRFRDNNGGTLADGSLQFTDPTTLHFTKTDGQFLPKSAYLYGSGARQKADNGFKYNHTSTSSRFGGTYSNHADAYRDGDVTMELSQNGNRLEGTLHYSTADGKINSGLLSVSGTLKDDMGHVEIFDQKGRKIATAVLSKQSDGSYHLIQNSPYTQWFPTDSHLFK